MTNIIKENLIILSQFLKEFETTGEICSSTKWAAAALTLHIAKSNTPRRIMEVGPGTGVVTKKILSDMGETDILILSEINSSFMDALKLRLSKDKNYQKHKERVFFILGPVQEIDNSEPLDIIICGIPFLNLDIPTIENIFSKLCQMSKPETLMTFYQYMGMRSLAKILPPKSRQDRVKRIENFFDQHFSEKHQNVLKVWLNFLPINIYTIKPYYYLQPAN